jgi:hypothetical protein
MVWCCSDCCFPEGGEPPKKIPFSLSSTIANVSLKQYAPSIPDDFTFETNKNDRWKFCFLICYIGAIFALFTGMMVYFLFSSCRLQNSIIDIYTVSSSGKTSYYKDTFSSGENHLCGAFLLDKVELSSYYSDDQFNSTISAEAYIFPCVLPGTKCSEYGKYNKDKCESNDGCEESVKCNEGLFGGNPHFDNIPSIPSPSVSVYYLTCTDAATAVSNSM